MSKKSSNLSIEGEDLESISSHENLLVGHATGIVSDKCNDLAHLLTEDIPLIGTVPTLFFVPECREAPALRK